MQSNETSHGHLNAGITLKSLCIPLIKTYLVVVRLKAHGEGGRALISVWNNLFTYQDPRCKVAETSLVMDKTTLILDLDQQS